MKLLFTLLSLVFSKTTIKDVYVGIDLGTTFTCVCMYDPKSKSYEYLTYNTPDQTIMPSIIYFNEKLDANGNPSYKVGYDAILKDQSNPNNRFYFYRFKPMVGLSDVRESDPLAKFIKTSTYKIEHKKSADNKGYYTCPVEFYTIDNKKSIENFTPTDLSSLILGNIKARIEAKNYNILKVCITTPVYFNTVQDNEVREAAVKANFTEPIISKEPVAACTTYVEDHLFTFDVEEKVMIFDFGGGTLDISIVEVIKEKIEEENNKISSMIVPTSYVGNNFLGGENVNDLLYAYYMNNMPVVPTTDIDKLRLRMFLENFKIALCNLKNSNVNQNVKHTDVFYLANQTPNDTVKEFTLTISEFDKIIEPIYNEINELLFDSVVGLFKDDIAKKRRGETDLLANSIKKVVLVGGSTRIPYIRKLCLSACPNATIFDKIETDLAVAKGASQICVNSDPNSGLSDVNVMGIVPLPIGIRVHDGTMQEIIRKDILIPTKSEMPFTTVYDNQTKIVVEIAMGVRPMFDDNEKIGQLELTLTRAMPRGEPKIMVAINYNADYSFEVSATEGNNTQRITFDSKLGKPSQSKVEQMLENAKLNFEADEKLKNKLEQLRIFDTTLGMFETQVKASKLSELDQSYFNTIIEGNKKWLEDNRATAEVAIIEAKIADLKKSVEEFSAKLAESSKIPQENKNFEEPKTEKAEAREVL